MTSGSTNNKGRQIAAVVLSFLLAAVFLYIVLRGVDFAVVAAILKKASFLWIAALCCTTMLAHYLRALRWKVMLSSVKPHVSVTNLFGALMTGYGVNCVVPRLGEVSRAILVGKWEGLSRTSMLGTVVVERIIDMAAFALSLVVSIFIWNWNLYASFPWLKATLYIAAFGLSSFIVVLILVIRYKDRFYRIIVKLAGRFSHEAAEKLAHIFSMLVDGFSTLKGARNYFYTIFLTAGIMAVYAVNSLLGFYTIGMHNLMPVTFGMAWIIMAISSISVVIPTPGGAGSYHTIARSVLVLLFGFAEEISVAYAVLTHIISYILMILSGIIFFVLLNRRYRNRTGRKVELNTILESIKEI